MNPHSTFISLTLGCFLIFFWTGIATGQHQYNRSNDTEDRVETVITPSISYSSDLGLMGGGGFQRYRLRPDYEPYYSLFNLNALVSTQGVILSRIQYNRTETFGTPVRSKFDLHGNRQLYSTYFGSGNETEFDSDLWEDDYYHHTSLSIGLEYLGRIPIFETYDFDGLISTGVSYYTPRDPQEDRSLFELNQQEGVPGFDGGFVNFVGTGFKRDTRDSELDPTEGFNSFLEGRVMNGVLFSDYNMQSLDFRQSAYYTVSWLADTRIAARVAGSQSFGDVPFWKEPDLGGDHTIRGYALNRFRGPGRVFYNLEIRNWLVTAEDWRLRFGVHAFTDGGRILDFSHDVSQLFNNYHRTFGGGVAYQILDSNMMLRIEAGFSEEMWRLYAGTGFMF